MAGMSFAVGEAGRRMTRGTPPTKMTIRITRNALESATSHAVREYPKECCGILRGVRRVAGGLIEQVVPADNIAEGDRTRSYKIDWNTLLSTLRLARDGPRQLVGFYHSHPDGSINPSESDGRQAWPGLIYLIVSMRIQEGGALWTSVAAWETPASCSSSAVDTRPVQESVVSILPPVQRAEGFSPRGRRADQGPRLATARREAVDTHAVALYSP